jgi:hypothetical protein
LPFIIQRYPQVSWVSCLVKFTANPYVENKVQERLPIPCFLPQDT